jgi:hypothetical protein
VSDPGAVERNFEFHERALERARIRNGNNGAIPQSQAESVVQRDLPVRSVNKPVRTTGGNNEEV